MIRSDARVFWRVFGTAVAFRRARREVRIRRLGFPERRGWKQFFGAYAALLDEPPPPPPPGGDDDPAVVAHYRAMVERILKCPALAKFAEEVSGACAGSACVTVQQWARSCDTPRAAGDEGLRGGN